MLKGEAASAEATTDITTGPAYNIGRITFRGNHRLRDDSLRRMLLLDEGAVAASGTPDEVLRDEALSRVYRCPINVRYLEGRWNVHVHPEAWKGLLNRPQT